MPAHSKHKGPYFRSTHKIDVLSYKKNTLQCICSWIGRAIDDGSGDELDWPTHRKTAPPVDVKFENKYAGRYGTTVVRPPKEKVKV